MGGSLADLPDEALVSGFLMRDSATSNLFPLFM